MQRDLLIHLLDRCKDAAFGLTPEGEVWAWNSAAERLFGYAAREAIGRPLVELLQARGLWDEPIDEAYCRLAVKQGSVSNFDMHVRPRSGEELWVNVTVLVFEALRPSPAVIVHFAHDITPAKQREALAEQLMETARRVLAVADPAGQFVPVTPLSEQEQRILRGFFGGKNAQEVTRMLGISPQTLRNHLHHINQKLGTHNRLEAVTHALRRRLI